MVVRDSLAPHLPYLRRYARALTGSQKIGDAHVRATLSALAAGTSQLAMETPPRLALYQVFHKIWLGLSGDENVELPFRGQSSAEEKLRALPALGRAALLLTAVEGFSLSEAGRILDATPERVEALIVEAQRAIERQLASRVLIIEDESIIALDLENLVVDLGHRVIGIASSHNEAVSKAQSQKLGLILADINLGEGGSGIDAVAELLRSFDIPVIFITAYPERLLTGERPEPTYLITKPFLPETVQATIGQALFFHSPKREAA